MRSIVYVSILALILLSGCAGIELKAHGVSLIEEPTEFIAKGHKYSSKDSKVLATGMLRIDVETNVDMKALSFEKGINIWFKAEFCDAKTELWNSTSLYELPSANESEKKYALLVDYKNDRSFSTKTAIYNLANKQERICVRVGGADKAPFTLIQSNVVELTLDEQLVERIRRYEARGGEVRFKFIK
jgi:hypothetical protein